MPTNSLEAGVVVETLLVLAVLLPAAAGWVYVKSSESVLRTYLRQGRKEVKWSGEAEGLRCLVTV